MNSTLEKTEIWNLILKAIEQNVGDFVFNNWFSRITFNGFNDETRTLALTTDAVTYDWVVMYYRSLLMRTMETYGCGDYRIEWSIEENENQDDRLSKQIDDVFSDDEPADEPDAAAPPAPYVRTAATNFVDIEPIENSLNPKYTFEKFVVGSSNQFAHAASLGAAESPGKRLFFAREQVSFCRNGLNQLIRESTRLATGVTSRSVMAEHLTQVRFYQDPQSFHHQGELGVNLTFSQRGETVQFSHKVEVNNVP